MGNSLPRNVVQGIELFFMLVVVRMIRMGILSKINSGENQKSEDENWKKTQKWLVVETLMTKTQ